MKFHALFLAVLFGAATLQAQTGAPPESNSPVLLAQAAAPSKKDSAVTAINDRGAKDAKDAKDAAIAAAASAEDTMTISANRASASAPSSESTTGAVTPVTLWKLILDGGYAMIPLGALSVITVMLVLVYLFTLRRSSILSPQYMNTADVLLKKRDYLGLLAISSRHSEAVARVVQRTLDFATKNPTAPYDVVREIAETEAGSQAASLQHRTVYLADIGMLSPMIGLLGTVIGIIRSFGLLGSGQTTTSRDLLLANGVSEALIATAAGLVLGILAMFFYSIFRNRVQSLISDLEIATAHIIGLVALNYGKKRDNSRVAVDEEY
jgi:biopolymer transport protein ExbB